jgi:SAM-dependent methyltransferase
VNKSVNNLVEAGCGYGIFTVNAAKRISGNLSAFDIEQEMIDCAREKAEREKLMNISFFRRDIIEEGFGLEEGSTDYVMLFNILHHERPLELLNEAHKILIAGGKVGIIHWRTDMETPRGPDMSIRPKPGQCINWAEQAGFRIYKTPEILEPWHYGLILQKTFTSDFFKPYYLLNSSGV